MRNILVPRSVVVGLAVGMFTLSAAHAQCPFAVSDVAATATAANDGLLLVRAAQNLRDSALMTKSGSTRTGPAVITDMARDELKLDVNGSGAFDETDAAIIVRHLMGFRNDALIPLGAGFGAARKTGATIQSYIDGGCVATPPARKKLSQMKAEQFATANGGVFISVLDHVEIDQDVDLTWLEVQGTLWCSDRDLALSSGWIVVHGGKLQCGTALNPFTKKLTITLTGNDPTQNALGMMGAKVLGAMHGGRVQLYGEQRTSWTTLGATAAAGATQISLKEPAAWRVGERIVIASTSFEPNEAEERTITAINGAVVTINQPLAYRHYGDLQTFEGKTLDSRAEVGLLSRNIVIQGDSGSEAAQFGGHVMIMGSSATTRETNPSLRSSAKIRGVEFRRLGQFNRLGRYPFHWHLNGTSDGDFLENSVVHSSIQRGIVVHGTDGVLVKDNVVYKTPGHSYVVEDGTERASMFERNLGLLPNAITLTVNGLKNQNDQGAAVFWLRTAASTLRNNSAAGGSFAGYWFDMGFIDGNSATKGLLTFQNNTVHSHRLGRPLGEADSWAVWHTDGFVPSEEGVLRFEGLTAYKNERVIETVGRSVTSNAMIADNGAVITGGTLKDSVVVSRSANTDTDPSWGLTGLFAYGGFANTDNVTWINFKDGRSVARTLACGIEYPRFSNRQAKLVNSDTAAGCGDVILSDLDGSLSGTGRPQKLVGVEGRTGFPGAGTNRYGLVTQECQVTLNGLPQSFAVCPDFDYRALAVTYPNGPTQNFSNDNWQVDVVRVEDGDRVTPDHFRWVSYTVPGKAYRLEVRNRLNSADTTDYGLQNLAFLNLGLSEGDFSKPSPEPGGRAVVFDPLASTRAVMTNALNPTGAYRIRACARGVSCDQNASNWPVVSAASSVSALQATTTSGFTVEGGRIHFKLLGGEQLRFER